MKKYKKLTMILLLTILMSPVCCCTTAFAQTREWPIPIQPGEKTLPWSGVDTNPTSPTFNKTIAASDCTGHPSVWIATFDSSC